MCARNAELFLRAAVSSILQQTERDFELICVDDGSTDGTLRILQEYAQQDTRVRLLLQPHQRGVAASLVAGLAMARAPLVARMDADDVSLPERLQLQRHYMDAHSDIDVLVTAVEAFGTSAAARTIALPTGAALVAWSLRSSAHWRTPL